MTATSQLKIVAQADTTARCQHCLGLLAGGDADTCLNCRIRHPASALNQINSFIGMQNLITDLESENEQLRAELARMQGCFDAINRSYEQMGVLLGRPGAQ